MSEVPADSTPKAKMQQQEDKSDTLQEASEDTPIHSNIKNTDDTPKDDEVVPLIDEDAIEKESNPDDDENEEQRIKYEVADFVDHEIKRVSSQLNLKDASTADPSRRLTKNNAPRLSPLNRSSKKVGDDAKLAMDEKNGRVKDSLRRSSPQHGSVVDPLRVISLDDDVAKVDALLFRASTYSVLTWIGLIIFAYWITPPEQIEWLEGTERNAALVELSILSTAVAMKHGPLFWEMNLFGSAPSLESRHRRSMIGSLRISGILAGGLVVQTIAVATMIIMVSFPVPVLIDPILKSRVHLLRWCEWTPLAGLMTLMTECIDAPEYDGEKLTQPWNKKLMVSAFESISTFCGFIFPFCDNLILWTVTMIISCVLYSTIIFRYFEKRRLFRTAKRGRSVDEIELYDRARMSLSLHGMCCVAWTGITVIYFVTSAGHLFVPLSWTLFHDPAATIIGECFMDLVAKILYMALILEAHVAAFDEAKRANRRLAELRNTMSVVWENSSDTIAISVRKASGNVTTMISPSFFQPALIARQEENIDNISAVVLEISNIDTTNRKDSITDWSKVNAKDLKGVGMRIIQKADFADIDLHSATRTNKFEPLNRNDPMSPRAISFVDMLSRAWRTKMDEIVFEHDAILQAGSSRTKFEVKLTRLEENAVVIVVRDVSERYRRFEAEKRFVFETTARQKDAEANRFTRHEVKNGLLAAIEICGNVREQVSADFNLFQKGFKHDMLISEESVASRVENVTELDRTLHEVLDIVLAETMARDVIHEMYVPRMERIDVNHILSQMRGFQAKNDQFTVVCRPSPLPIFLSDQGLFKCIHGNAIRNAIKYGKNGGNVTVEATYDSERGHFKMDVLNLPGPGHEKLMALGSRASELVFSHGTRLHKDSGLEKNSHSAGDGAWIIRKCAKILGGNVDIQFEETRTVFSFQAPVKVYDAPSRDVGTFHLPPGVWGIAIDDSKIQRKLLRRFFIHAGIQENRQVILGHNRDEISGFVEFIIDFVKRHPDDLIFLIADENLEMEGSAISDHETISGSECIKRIRSELDLSQERRMLALVRSANDSPDDLALYNSRAHGYMPKVPLRGISVREMVSPLWTKRFPKRASEVSNESDEEMSRIASIENLRDLTLISPAELLADLKEIDNLCVKNDSSEMKDKWPVIWDKLHQLKGDIQSVNVDDEFSDTIILIEALRGDSAPADFMSKWLRIRSHVFSHFCSRSSDENVNSIL
mmetsp:Transcript_29734/g.46009  ORF Transcript_29734/g.46009 Transcript_29734/m.46009 type:complete len:1225 (-) Transcript_29734:27-3701(-)